MSVASLNHYCLVRFITQCPLVFVGLQNTIIYIFIEFLNYKRPKLKSKYINIKYSKL